MTDKFKEDADSDSGKMECPSCGELIQSEAILCRFCDSGLSQEYFRACGQCSEMIRKEALICRYCKAPMSKAETPFSAVKVQRDASVAVQGDVSNIPAPARSIIRTIHNKLLHSSDIASILQDAIEALTLAVQADRGILWQIEGDHLVALNEFSRNGHKCFEGNQLGAQESTSIVLEFLSSFSDETGSGCISFPDTSKDTILCQVSPTLKSLLELGNVGARLLAQLRSRAVFSGFIEIQQCACTRDWTALDAGVVQAVAETLSVVIQLSFGQKNIELSARDMKLFTEISDLFRSKEGANSEQSLVRSVGLVAAHTGFSHAQVYIYEPTENILKPLMKNGNGSSENISVLQTENPFAHVFETGRGSIVNAEHTRKSDSFFKHDMAVVMPLISEGERLGVVGWWQRLPNSRDYRPSDRQLCTTLSTFLAQAIHIRKLKG